MRKMLLLAAMIFLYHSFTLAQEFNYPNNSNKPQFNLVNSSPQKMAMSFAIESWTLNDISVNRQLMQKIELPGHFLPNDEGMPDLPGSGHYIAIPQGSVAHLEITSLETETLQNIELAPAPRIPKTTENGDLFYAKNESVYFTNALYPAEPIKLSEPTQVRGVDVVMLGVTPFQYNPVTKELVILRNIEIEVTFEGSNGQFGENRLRSRWWDPMLSDMLVNYDQLLPVDYSGRNLAGGREIGYEYLIVCPDDPDFLAWADTIRLFRNKQGIKTGIVTTTEMGGNTVSAIRSYFNNAYNTWDIPPAAILILGDYGTSGSTVISPIWDNYCASDNIFVDVNNDDLPDMVISRIFGQNAAQLELMINKFIGYETNPPTNLDFYAHPVTALGWQTERWFQICIEVVGGFLKNSLGKDPVRVNAVYDGNPTIDPWSTAPNTNTIMNYFGPNGLDYIPTSPATLGSWSGGNANQINAALNSGSFLLLHRDHGFEQGWGEPSYNNSSMGALNNTDLTFVYSVNCLTGKFNYGGECFAEAFYRHPDRALGIIAASEVSYSFVNDTYVWGAFDNMWPEFMPGYGSNPEPRGLLPAFSNAAGKFFLQQSSWPYNSGNKEVTYHLFHHFGDAFSTIYSEVPQNLLVIHNEVVMGGSPSFTVQADDQSFIALSVDGEIIGTAEGTGSPVNISIPSQLPGTMVDIVITKTNYFRYENRLQVISPNSPYVVYQDHLLNDENENGLLDYAENTDLSLTIQNIGNVEAENLSVILSSSDPYILISDSTELAGNIPGNESLTLTDAFMCTVADSVPDGHLINFSVRAEDNDSSWFSQFYITAHAPVLNFTGYTIDDSEGNNNGQIDAGETVIISLVVQNSGSAAAFNVMTSLSCPDSYISISSEEQDGADLESGESSELSFSVTAAGNTPGGFNADFNVNILADHYRSGQGAFICVIGQYSALVLDLDPTNNSAPALMESFSDMDLIAEYLTELPADLKNYKSVFVCLGIYYSSHTLTDAEALVLKNYLDNGGKIYMEGRLTWHTDPQTSLHEMFNISTEETSWYIYENIFGVDETFSEGMMFTYDMNQPYNNHYLHATSPAYELFRLSPDSLGLTVAYDAGNYKTIGSNFEFGSLIDNGYPTTKNELMSRILEFFGDILTGTGNEPRNEGNLAVQTYPNPFANQVNFSFNLVQTSKVTLEIYDLTGRIVNKIFEGSLSAGNHILSWEIQPKNNINPGGLYFYRLISGTDIQSGKLIMK